MKKNQHIVIGIICIIIAFPIVSSAQLSKGGTPKSFQLNLKSTTQTVITGTVDVQKLLLEDAQEEKQGVAQRFGYPFDVNYTLLNSGNWQTMQDGSKTWKLQIESPGAYSINLIYDNFWLPEGAEFFIYNEDRTMVIGAFTSQNNKPYNEFATAPVKGDVIILELNVPSGISYPGEISISRIVHAYRNIFDKFSKAFGSSGSCNNNVNCPEGDLWQDQTNSVAMIILGSGFRWCSGSMINNVRQDLTPYFLTAEHCLNSPSTFIFMFNYQSPNCSNIDGPTTMTTQGSTLLASDLFSDFALLLLDETPPDSFNLFYSGWSNINTAASSSVGIHHPAGDIKKISFNDNAITSTSYFGVSSGNNSHWRVDNWEDGTTEGGSSGSPLFDQNQRIIGQLHGGNASCASNTDDWYGKFSASWNGTSSSNRLIDWLDPDNTGATTLDGIDANGLVFNADTTIGWIPLDVQFTANAIIPVNTWSWDFGDGDSSSLQNPLHSYTSPGAFNVQLDATSGTEQIFKLKQNYIVALADTLSIQDAMNAAGSTLVVTLNAENNIPLNEFLIPIEYGGDVGLTIDSISSVGCRTDYFEIISFIHFDAFSNRVTARLKSTSSNTQPDLPVGNGAILKIYFTISSSAQLTDTTVIQIDGYTAGTTYLPSFIGTITEYEPVIQTGNVTVITLSCCVGIRGNFDGDSNENIDISDLVAMVAFMFQGGPPSDCPEEANIDASTSLPLIDISDLILLVDYMFQSGPAPALCP